MTYALLAAALLVPGCLVSWRLLRPLPPRAADLPVDLAEPDDVRFGFDSAGLV